MPTRNVSLTDHFDTFVEKSVNSGQYLNASEVVREGLRLLEQKNREDKLKLERLKDAVALGIADLENGRYQEFEPKDISKVIGEIGKRAAAKAARKAG